jgi:hypothetical protein
MSEADMSEHDRPGDAPVSSDGGFELLACARAALGGDAGAHLLRHLERRYLGHVPPPAASGAELRHLEGQRSVVLYLQHLIATARRGPSGDFA